MYLLIAVEHLLGQKFVFGVVTLKKYCEKSCFSITLKKQLLKIFAIPIGLLIAELPRVGVLIFL